MKLGLYYRQAKDELKKLIARKDINNIKNFNKNLFETLNQLINSSGPIRNNIEKIKKIKFGDSAKEEIQNFINISNILFKQFNKFTFFLNKFNLLCISTIAPPI